MSDETRGAPAEAGPPAGADEWREVEARLRAEADRDYPTAWIPDEPGDELAGVVVAIRPAVRTAFGPVPVIELEELRTHATYSLWLTHTVLRRECARARPLPGETMLVRYGGRVTPEGGGPPYAAYRVVVDRPDVGDDVDWSAIAERYGDEPAGENRDAGGDSRAAPGGDDDDIPF